MIIEIKNGWGVNRVGIRQRKIIEHIIRYPTDWNWFSWISQLDRESLNGLERKGIVVRICNGHNGNSLSWKISEDFMRERVTVYDDSSCDRV